MDAMAHRYLERIGHRGSLDLTRNTLCALQRAHLLSVPYENMDILAGRRLDLSVEGLQGKIVMRKRGGYCFELNALFGWLLKQLGFRVENYFGRFLRGEPEIPMRRHHVLIASCDEGQFVCDVGVGIAISREPLALVPGLEQNTAFGSYKLERDPLLGWVIYSLERGEWEWLYSFTEEPQLPIDYAAASFFCEAAPESIFNKEPMIAIRTEGGRKTIDGMTLKIFAPDGVRVTELADQDALRAALDEHFGIRL